MASVRLDRSRASRVTTAFALVALTLAGPLHGQAPQRLAIAAASDLQVALPDIVREFERSSPARVSVSYGSSGSFFAQIQNGAPFDVFLSADLDYPRQLAKAGLADPSSLQVYGTGHLVLWTRRGTNIDLSRGLDSLSDTRIRHIAIANPKYAPYGRAAVSALRAGRLYDTVQPKLVMGESLAQAAQLVESGNAEVGLLSRSLVLGRALNTEGTYVDVTPSLYPPIEQAGIVVTRSRQAPLARQFIAFLRGPAAQRYFERFGFTAPPTLSRTR